MNVLLFANIFLRRHCAANFHLSVGIIFQNTAGHTPITLLNDVVPAYIWSFHNCRFCVIRHITGVRYISTSQEQAKKSSTCFLRTDGCCEVWVTTSFFTIAIGYSALFFSCRVDSGCLSDSFGSRKA